MQHVFTETLQGAEGKEKQIVIIPIRLISASLAGGDLFHVTNDAGSTTYAAPHWADLNGNAQADASPTDKVSPVAFKATVQPKLTAAYALGAAVPTDLTLTMKTTSSNGFAIPQTVVPGGMGEQTLPDTTVTGSFPAIDYFNAPDNEVIWQVGAGGDFKDFGKSQMTVYVTAAAPVAAMKAESLYMLGCAGAKGMSGTGLATAKKVFHYFEIRDVRKTEARKAAFTGTQLSYWKTSLEYFSLQDLLEKDDGRCEAWAQCLKAVLGLHGIASEVKTITPPDYGEATMKAHFKQMAGDTGKELPPNIGSIPVLMVTDWKLAGLDWQGQPSSFHPTDLPGIEAQGNPDPQAFFTNHVVVLCCGQWFDPSYGDPPVASVAAWEDRALLKGGYGRAFQTTDAYINALTQTYFVLDSMFKLHVERADPPGSQETTVSP
jgi:hypothetical protein